MSSTCSGRVAWVFEELIIMQKITQISDEQIPLSLKDCHLKHLLSLISYDKTFDHEQINQFKPQIIAYLQWHKINGSKLSQTSREQFNESVIHFCSKNQAMKEPASKCWDLFNEYNQISTVSRIQQSLSSDKISKITKSNNIVSTSSDIDTKEEEKIIDPPNSTSSTVKNFVVDIPSSLNECNLEKLISLIETHEVFDVKRIRKFKDKIIAYLQKNQINGAKLSQIQKTQFSDNLVQFCENNKKAQAVADEIWDAFINKYDLIGCKFYCYCRSWSWL